VPRMIREENMSPAEFARRVGKNPEVIRNAMRAGSFPLGFASRLPSGGWLFVIPRAPAEEFLRTGVLPK